MKVPFSTRDFVLRSLQPLLALVRRKLHDLCDGPRLAKVLLVRLACMLHHRLEGDLERIVVRQEVLARTRVDVLDASDHCLKRALERILVVTSQAVKFVV